MIQIIAAFCYLAFFVLAVASPVMPVYLTWRLAGLSGLAYATGKFIEGPVHWSDQNFSYAIGVAILFLFCCAIALAIFIRLAVSAMLKTLSVDAMIGPKNKLMHLFDIGGLVAIGCFAGLLLAQSLAYMLSGAAFGMNLDLTLAILAAIFAIGLYALSRHKVSITLTAVFATLAMFAVIGSRQSNHILDTAAVRADGRAWCLTAGGGSGPISDIRQLGFFALPKGGGYPHLGLLVRDGNQTQLVAHWSIRRQTFVEARNTSARVPACYPIENFAEELESGRVEADIYGVGSDVFAIMRERHPQVFMNRVSIRSDQLIGPNSVHPEMTERMTLTYSPREPYALDGTVPLSMMPDPTALNADDLTGANRLIVAGIDDTTKQRLRLYCLHGPYADRLCRAQVFDGSVGYDFYLPLAEINQWQDATDQVKAIFESLKVEPFH